MMDIMYLSDGVKTMRLTPSEAIDLELKLNVSKNGRKWSDIGDMLYVYGLGNAGNAGNASDKGKAGDKGNAVNASEQILVSSEQYQYLVLLRSIDGWRNVKESGI
jgi:hypothetical protein